MQYYILAPITKRATTHNYLNNNPTDPLDTNVGKLFYI